MEDSEKVSHVEGWWCGLYQSVNQTIFVTMKNNWESNLKEEKFILAHSLRGPVYHWWEGHGGAEKKQREERLSVRARKGH
jgi:hypothetical protein